MSQDRDYLMKQMAKEILKADRWRCKLCDHVIDARSYVSVEDEKHSLLLAHLHDAHNESLLVNKDMKDEHKVLYFRPIVETIQQNIKFQ